MAQEELDYEDEELQMQVAPVARADVAIGDVIQAKALLAKLQDAFNKVMGSDPKTLLRFLRMGVSALQYNRDLAKCDQLSFCLALMQCAEIGLMPGPTLGHAYLVPFADKSSKLKKVVLIPGYRGYIHCAYRAVDGGGRTVIARFLAEVVSSGDTFEYELGDRPFIRHIPSARGVDDETNITHAYSLCWLRDSDLPIPKVINRDEIDAARERSRAKNAGPWVTDFGAMARKTAVRRLQPFIPQSYELFRAIALERYCEEDRDMKRYQLGGTALSVGDATKTEEPAVVVKTRREPETKEPPRMPPAPQRAVSEVPGDRQELLHRIADLQAALENAGAKFDADQALGDLPEAQLVRLEMRLKARLEAQADKP